MKKNNLLICVYVFVLISLFFGILTRYANIGLISNLQNLKSAHSHFGIFSVVMPLIWLSEKKILDFIATKKKLFIYYSILAVASLFTFLHSNYNYLSHILSFGIQGFWIYIVWNSKIPYSSVLFNLLISQGIGVLIVFLIMLNKKFNLEITNLPQFFVLQFLTLSVYPTVLYKFRIISKFSWFFTFSLLLFCAALLFPLPSAIINFSLISFVLLHLYLLQAFKKSSNSNSLVLAMYLLLVVSIVKLLGFIDFDHFVKIAGIHFLVFVIAIGHLLDFYNIISRKIFLNVSYMMCFFIVIQGKFLLYFKEIEYLLIIIGTALLAIVLYNLMLFVREKMSYE